MQEEPTIRVRTVDYHEDKSSEAEVIVEKAASLPSSLKQDQEKLAHINVYEGPAPQGCGPSSSSPGSQQAYLVEWDGEHDEKHPRNWSTRRKWTVMAIGQSASFIYTSKSADINKPLYCNSCHP